MSVLGSYRIVAQRLVVLVNWVMYRHAYAMTHFVPNSSPHGGAPTLGDRLRRLLFGTAKRRPENRTTPADFGLAYEEHEIAGGLGRLSAWYLPHPRRRGLVMLFHGYQRCKSQLLAQAQAFHEMGYACFLLDFPGSGGSQRRRHDHRAGTKPLGRGASRCSYVPRSLVQRTPL